MFNSPSSDPVGFQVKIGNTVTSKNRVTVIFSCEYTCTDVSFQMHIVLYSTKYADFNLALDKPKGLAVLSFLFEVRI